MKRFAPVLILLLAFGLRVIGLTSDPPGWRDDEVIETTVHAQLVLDGHYPLYFIQAEGHEPLYHYLTAGWIALVGRSLFTVRLVSVIFGVLTVAAAYRLTRQLFGARAALLVMLLLAISFWALMYSRTKIRHISELPFMLLAFSHLFKVISNWLLVINRRVVIVHSIWFVIFATLGLYTYLAATTVFIIIAAFLVYLLITNYFFKSSSYKLIATLFVALIGVGVLYWPLANAIRANAARISVVGGPLTALREGNWQPLIDTTIETLGMFGHTGDNEALYNMPGRPVFNLVGFVFFAGGVLIALSRWRDPRYAFLLIWLVGGLAPGFASNPPASLGHTITALPVTYLLAALPAVYFSTRRIWASKAPLFSVGGGLGAVLLVSVLVSDLPDYFLNWPRLPQVRYLYKADLHNWANAFQTGTPATVVFSGSLSKWDRVAFGLEGLNFASPPRWVNAEWAMVFPSQAYFQTFELADWQTDGPPQQAANFHFSNDLTFEGFSQNGRELFTHWRVEPGYEAIEPDMGSSVESPPFPTFIFVHLLDATGALVAGSDRFDVDAYSLQPGDRILQRHAFDPATPAGSYSIELGLYDPVSGVRYALDDGRDAVIVGQIELP